MKTSFIRPLQIQGGTFYSFSSSDEDLTTTFNNSTNKFKFSKFALLNIPDIDSDSSLDNKVKLNGPDGAFLDWAEPAGIIITGNGNVDFSQSFQSYCLNLESTLISSDDYDRDLKQNISERIFFKWLKETGAIRFKAASEDEVSSTLDQDTVIVIDSLPQTEKRYTEGDPIGGTGSYGLTGATYNNVVKYIGNLDIVNSVSNSHNAYSEVYVHVPTKDGNTPTILFKNVIDSNYLPDYSWQNNPKDPLDREYINGRAYNELNPSGLTNLAIFDSDSLGAPTVNYIDTIDGATGAGNWYTPRDMANTYYTDQNFTEPSSLIITKDHKGNQLEYARTKLDSIGIDFDPDSYKEILDNPAITTIEEFNSTSNAKDFKFNAVLIYYDVYDPSDPSDYVTNLYGVLFLDDVISEGGDTYIPRLNKYKPNESSKLNGNSWGLKLNIKIESDIDQAGVEQAINDYSPFSLSMFMDSMNVLQDASGTLNNSASGIIKMEQRITELEDIALSDVTALDLDKRIKQIEQNLSANQALFNNTKSIMGLINQNYDLIKAIINNETSAKISYDLDSIKQGSGTMIDRSIKDQVVIKNINQEYNIGENNGFGTITTEDVNVIKLNEFSNYFKHVNGGSPLQLTSDVLIRIDDTYQKWKRGQKFRFSFGDSVYPGSYYINFYTDSTGKYPESDPSGTQYSKYLISLDEETFQDFEYRPVIEIICIDDKEYKFQIDIIGKSLTNNT